MDPGILDCLVQFKTSDLVGNNPNIFFYGASYGFVSGLTLRYVHVMVDFVQHFGDLSGFDIVEIGGGFGGQSKIISDAFSVSSYTIVDIPEAVALISRFQEYFPAIKARSILLAPSQDDLGETVHGKSLDDHDFVLPSYDLCISNYAFTELDLKTRKRYWPLLKRCTRGYIIDNSRCQQESDVQEGARELGTPAIGKRLEELGRKVKFEAEIPQTGCNNEVMTWTTPAL